MELFSVESLHDDTKIYICKTCNYKTISINTMKEHVNTHQSICIEVNSESTNQTKQDKRKAILSKKTLIRNHISLERSSDNSQIYTCEMCNYATHDISNMRRHIKTKKHISNLEFRNVIKKTRSMMKGLHCICCNFTTLDKSKFKRHMMTNKHKRYESKFKLLGGYNEESEFDHSEEIDEIEEIGDKEVKEVKEIKEGKSIQQQFFCESCGKAYKTKSGLWKHKKSCTYLLDDISIQEEASKNVASDNVNNDIIMKVIQDNQNFQKMMMMQQTQLIEQQKQFTEIIPKIGNTITNTQNNNRFNINVFLHENCKDAMNISQFIENINVSLAQLEFSRKHGVVEGISKLFIEQLEKLDITQRPIHCTDLKRDILYIKDNDKWGRDEEKTKINTCINEIAQKHGEALEHWVADNPDWYQDENKQDIYIELCDALVCSKTDKTNKSIIKNIADTNLSTKEQ